jgi:hypothetical protein
MAMSASSRVLRSSISCINDCTVAQCTAATDSVRQIDDPWMTTYHVAAAQLRHSCSGGGSLAAHPPPCCAERSVAWSRGSRHRAARCRERSCRRGCGGSHDSGTCAATVGDTYARINTSVPPLDPSMLVVVAASYGQCHQLPTESRATRSLSSSRHNTVDGNTGRRGRWLVQPRSWVLHTAFQRQLRRRQQVHHVHSRAPLGHHCLPSHPTNDDQMGAYDITACAQNSLAVSFGTEVARTDLPMPVRRVQIFLIAERHHVPPHNLALLHEQPRHVAVDVSVHTTLTH